MSENGRGGGSAGGEGAAVVGGVLCGVGLAFAVFGFVSPFLGGGSSIVSGAVGIMLGVVGYVLGARRLAIATVVVCVLALVFGLAASQGLVPGFEDQRDIRGLAVPAEAG